VVVRLRRTPRKRACGPAPQALCPQALFPDEARSDEPAEYLYGELHYLPESPGVED